MRDRIHGPSRCGRPHRGVALAAVALVGLLGSTIVAGPAAAAETGWWQLSAKVRPTVIQPGGEATIGLEALNLGDAAISGRSAPVKLRAQLPPGLVATEIYGVSGILNFTESSEGIRGPLACSLTEVSCTWEGPELLQPYEPLELYVTVRNEGAAAGSEVTATISGGESVRCLKVPGGAFRGPFCAVSEETGGSPGSYEAESSGVRLPPVSTRKPLRIEASTTPFGLAEDRLSLEGEGGGADSQAGAHPFQLTSVLGFDESESRTQPPAFTRNLDLDLPPGLIGNATTVAQCDEVQFSDLFAGNSNACPSDSAIGVATVRVITGIVGFNYNRVTLAVPVFNLVPAPGEPARFGFEVERTPVLIDTSLRTGSDYGITTRVSNISQFATLLSANVVIWGTPGASAHRLSRGWSCVAGGLFREREEVLPACGATGETRPPTFLRAPTSCGGPLRSSVEIASWADPQGILDYRPSDFANPEASLDGCNRVPFEPSIHLEPDVRNAETPTGPTIAVHLPQGFSEAPEGIAESDLRDATVTLPEGMTVDPASAEGLASCTPAQIELDGPNPAACPEASKIGTVEIDTPLIDHPLPGAVYLATQEDNPFHSLLALYITVDDPISGVVVKLAGHVEPDPSTGRLTTVVSQSPQLPFEDLKLHLFGGARAPLQTPPTCGTATTSALFTPWSGNAAVPSSSSFQVTSGANGGACATTEAGLPNKPSFEAGTTNPIAGAYSPFVLRIARADGSQRLRSIEATLPAGLLGRLAGVPYCSEAQIAAATARNRPGEGAAELAHPSCPGASQVGTVRVGAGAGPTPLQVEGKAYLAGPYKGAPLSLVIITPAVAGPFDLGDVVVRNALYVNETTAQIHAVSDPLPAILDGIPLDIRSVALSINRPEFTINPTNCEPSTVSGSAISTLGGIAPLSQRFQVGACAALGFKPGLKLSLTGQTRRAGHPALKAVLTYPKSGSYANIARAQVSLPGSEFLDQGNLNLVCKQADLKAGTCPKSSIYGKVKAWSPLLEKPLQGNVYLGVGFGYKLPALVAELNGQIKVLLVGKIDTDKQKGIRNTFQTVPDAAVSRFELSLKGGKKYGLLENSENLCKKTQKARASFTAQNGKVESLTPTITNSCGKGKAKKPRKSKGKKK